MASLDPQTAAETLAKRMSEDEQFRESVLENPIAALESLGIDRDLAWEMIGQAYRPSPQSILPQDWCGGWLTSKGCQCTGFEMGCSARSKAFVAKCTTQNCG
jgi:hypothetical protein